MKDLKHYYNAIKGHIDKEESVIEIMCCALKKLKYHDEDDYNYIMNRIHCVLYGYHFDECTAKAAVAEMHNVDGTVGEHWSYNQAQNLAQQHGIKEVADFYWAINMLYSDLYQVMGGDIGTYVKMAKALYFTDPDAPEGKAFKQYLSSQH